MMNRYALVLILSGFAGVADAAEGERAPVLKLFAESRLTLTVPAWVVITKPRDLTIGRHGSAFVVLDAAGEPVLVTAAHVVTGPLPVGTIQDGDEQLVVDGDDVRLEEHRLRVRIGELALHPAALLVDHEVDVALLRLRPEDRHLIGVTPLSLRETAASTGTEIEAWGYPRQVASPQLMTGLRVSDVQDGFFVLNKPLEAGCSGGPALSGGKVIGLIARSAGEQARCVRADVIRQLLRSSGERWRDYADGLNVENLPEGRPDGGGAR